MYNTYLTSRITLRTKTSLSFNDYSYCSNERHPFAYTSPRTCCSCCASNSMCKVPITPIYCYSSYGLRQSCLIQLSPCRKLISSGFNRGCYARVPVCDVDRSCYCGKDCRFEGKSVGSGRKGGLRKCMVFEERSERYDLGVVDEAEVLLSLLTEDVGEEGFHVKKETPRLVKKPVVEKKDTGKVSKKKRVDLDDLRSESRSEYESMAFGSRDEDNRREERIRREEYRREMLQDKDNKRAGRVRREEERYESEAFGTRNKDNRREERFRREEEWEDLSREENRIKMLQEETTDNRREERIRRERREALLREENRKEMLLDKNKDNKIEERIRREDERYESASFGTRIKDNRKEERILREEEREDFSREENRKKKLQEENMEWENKESWDALLRKAEQKDDEKQRRGSISRKENPKVSARTEERGASSRVENKNKMLLDQNRDNRREEGREALSSKENRKEMLLEQNRDNKRDERIQREEERYESATYDTRIKDNRREERILRDESVVFGSRNKDNSREERILREEERVAFLREENRKKKLREEENMEWENKESWDALLRKAEQKDDGKKGRGSISRKEKEALMRKTNQKDEVKNERETISRKENQREEREDDLSRREEHRQKLRREGSSCSSYYSVSSTGDYDSDNEIEVKEGRFTGESSSGHKRHSRSEDYRIGHGVSLTEKKSANEIEPNFRKKSEKKLSDARVEEIESRMETPVRENDTTKEKSSDYYVGYDDRKAKSNEKTKFDRQTGDEVHKQYKQFVEMKGSVRDDVGNSSKVASSSQQGIDLRRTTISQQEIDLRKTSISQQEIDIRKTTISQQETDVRKTSISGQGVETSGVKKQGNRSDDARMFYGSQEIYSGKGEMPVQVASSSQETVGLGTKEDAYGRNSRKAAEVSEIQEIDLRKTHISQQGIETSVKNKEDYSTSSGLVESRVESQQLMQKEGTSISRSQSDSKLLIKQKKKFVNLAYGSSSESKNSADFIAIDAEDRNKTESEIIVRPEPVESNVGIVTNEGSSGSSQFGSAATHGQSSRFVSREVSIGSAARSEKSSARFVDEIVDKVKNELLGSEMEKQTNYGRGGPSDEMWGVDEQSVKDKVQDDDARSKGGNAIAKRTGKSLWNVMTDIVRLRWSPHSGSQSSGKIEVGSSSSTQEGDFKNMGLINAPSSSSAEIVEFSTPSPALKMQRSPVVRRVSETGEANTGSTDQSESSDSKGDSKLKQLQRNDQVLADRFGEWEEAYRVEAEQRKIDEMFMREALLEARKAADSWEVPVGAVLVQNGKVIARGYNLVEEMRDSTAHAEMICIREASNLLKTWRLSDTTLYVTLEPCPMCAGAILQARVDTVVWGAPNKLLGADGSWIRLFPSGDGGNNSEQTDKPAPPVHPFHPKIVIRRVVLASECADAMQQFFQLRRKNKDKKPDPTPPSRLNISHHPSKFLTKMHHAFHILFCL